MPDFYQERQEDSKTLDRSLLSRGILHIGIVDDDDLALDYYNFLHKCLLDLAFSTLEEVHVFITSNGGLIMPFMALYEALNLIRVSDKKLITVATGYVASAAVPLFLAGTERLIFNTAHLMVHEGSDIISGSFSRLSQEVENFNKIEKVYFKILAENSHLTEAEWRDKVLHKDVYFNAQECVKLGLADKIIAAPDLRFGKTPKRKKAQQK